MNLNQLLGELSERNVNLWSEGEQLKIRAPQGVLTSKLRDLLAEHKEALLLLLRQNNNNPRATSIPPIPISQANSSPLSVEQERLWAIAQLIPNRAVHNITQAVRLQGELNIQVLQSSLNEIVRRHAALRTNFTIVAGSPVQMVAPNLNVDLAVVDVRGLNPTEQTAAIQELVEKEAQQPFDLDREPLFEFKLS